MKPIVNKEARLIQVLDIYGRNLIAYKGQYVDFDFMVKMNKNRIIENFYDAGTRNPKFPPFE